MTAKDFFALDLQPGERVFVQVGAHEPKVAVFNGYATRAHTCHICSGEGTIPKEK